MARSEEEKRARQRLKEEFARNLYPERYKRGRTRVRDIPQDTTVPYTMLPGLDQPQVRRRTLLRGADISKNILQSVFKRRQ